MLSLSVARDTWAMCVDDRLTERIPFEQKVVGFLVQEECYKKKEGGRKKNLPFTG